MSETDLQRLFAMMEIAEAQQSAVQASLEGLATERAALKREREQLARGVLAMEQGTRAAVRDAVLESMAGAADEGGAGGHPAAAG